MIKAIVFSNNSPKALDVFLQSAKDKDIKCFEFSILYKTDVENSSEYLSVFEKYGISLFEQETVFKDNLLYFLNKGDDNLVSFFKDTNYFFSEMPDTNIEDIMSDQDIFCMSLSLGRNVKTSYANDCTNVLLNEENIGKNYIKWNWTKHYLDFGRPLSFDGHVFRTKDIYKPFKKWKYENIFELEFCFDLLDYYPRELMSSFNKSILIDIINKSGEENFKEKINNISFENIEKNAIEI